MIKVGVVYFSKTDVTGVLAQALIAGIESQENCNVIQHQIDGREIVEGRFINHHLFEKLTECDAIVFGSPTYMGSVSAQFKAFADATSDLWGEQLWADKIAAGFTSGTAVNGDQTSTLQYFVTLASQHGMLWVGLDSAHGNKDCGVNRMGCQIGVVAHAPDGKAHENDLATAHYLGRRVAKLTHQIKPAF